MGRVSGVVEHTGEAGIVIGVAERDAAREVGGVLNCKVSTSDIRIAVDAVSGAICVEEDCVTFWRAGGGR